MPDEQDGKVLAEIYATNGGSLTLVSFTDTSGDPQVVDAGPKLRLVTRVPMTPATPGYRTPEVK